MVSCFLLIQSPTVVCSLCKREGHLKRDCPEDFKKIELDPLPPLTPKFSAILDQVCIQCYSKLAELYFLHISGND